MKRTITFMTVCLAVIVLLTGCQKHELEKVEENTLVLYEDGTVSVVSIEEFDKNTYDKKGLTAFINQEIDSYNASTAGAVKLEKLTVKKGVARMIVKYKDVDTYTGFIKNLLKICTINELADLGTDIPEEFNLTTGGTIGMEDLRELVANQKILVITEPYKVELRGKEITHYSGASEVTGGEARISSDNSVSYLIYK